MAGFVSGWRKGRGGVGPGYEEESVYCGAPRVRRYARIDEAQHSGRLETLPVETSPNCGVQVATGNAWQYFPCLFITRRGAESLEGRHVHGLDFGWRNIDPGNADGRN